LPRLSRISRPMMSTMAVMLIRFRFLMPGFYRIEFEAKRPEPGPGRLIKRKHDTPQRGTE